MISLLQRLGLLLITPFGLAVTVFSPNGREWWSEWERAWRACPMRWKLAHRGAEKN